MVDTGLVQAPQDGSADVVIDVPSGRVTARVHRERGRTVAVDFVNVPSYVLAREIPLATSRGQVAVTVAYGGAIYASLDAASAGLTVDASHYRELIALGREVKWALNDTGHAVHPVDSRLSGVYGAIVHEDLGSAGGQVHQRNVTVFADGEVDRSPCGSGTWLARVQVRELTWTDKSAGLAIRWEASGPDGSLFPVLDADIKLARAGEQGTRLSVAGVYRSPFGLTGSSLERSIQDRVAAVTVSNFTASVAAQIAGRPGTAQAASPNGAGATPPPA